MDFVFMNLFLLILARNPAPGTFSFNRASDIFEE
jgi:hypothetical protein